MGEVETALGSPEILTLRSNLVAMFWGVDMIYKFCDENLEIFMVQKISCE